MIVERWDTCEFSLDSGREYANPFADVRLISEFIHGETGKKYRVNGFYDGGATWRFRFMPTEHGVWKYRTSCDDPDLDGKCGAVECVEAVSPHLRGRLVTRGRHFFYEDGTPCFLISTRMSCHVSPPEVWTRAVDFLRERGVNRIFFMMGGVFGTVRRLYGEGPDFDRYDAERFRAIDAFIDALRLKGIVASPYFYYFNDGDQRKMTPEQDRAYLSYGMSRFGAYANVLPVLANEVEQKYTKNSRDTLKYNLESRDWCNEMGGYLKELAAFGQPVSVHSPMFMGENISAACPSYFTMLNDWPFPWTDCILKQVQLGSVGGARELWDDFRGFNKPLWNARAYARHNEILIKMRKYDMPVVDEEPGYEMAGYHQDDFMGGDNGYSVCSYNGMTPDTVLNSIWSAFTAGAYCMWGHLDTYEMGNPLQGIKRSVSPRYLRIISEFAQSFPYWEMEPMNEAVSAGDEIVDGQPFRTNFCLAKRGEIYIVFSANGGPIELYLEPGAPYRAERMDPRTGRRCGLGVVGGSPQTESTAITTTIQAPQTETITVTLTVEGREQVLILTRVSNG